MKFINYSRIGNVADAPGYGKIIREKLLEGKWEMWGMNYLRSKMCNFWGANMYGPIIPTKNL